jgi:hypothetical protein
MNVAAHPGYKPSASPSPSAAAKKPLAERIPFASAVNSKFIAPKAASALKPRGVKIPTQPHASWEDLVKFSGGSANAHLNDKIGLDGSITRDSHQGIDQEHIVRAALQEDRRL